MAAVAEKVVYVKPRKRIFMGFLVASTLLMAIFFYIVWYIGYPGLAAINRLFPSIFGGILTAIITLVAVGIFNIVLAVNGLKFIPFFAKESYALINMLFPLSVRLGKIFGVSRRRLEGSFITVSNSLFHRRNIRVKGSELLVVTPHCLQLASCPHRITRDPNNCKRCGGCNIGDLMKLADELGFTFFVATGGTLARQIIKEKRPKAVLAIACERDLMSGIQDVYPLPAVGILNIRPNGPCYNTKVDMDDVRKELEAIVIKDETDG